MDLVRLLYGAEGLTAVQLSASHRNLVSDDPAGCSLWWRPLSQSCCIKFSSCFPQVSSLYVRRQRWEAANSSSFVFLCVCVLPDWETHFKYLKFWIFWIWILNDCWAKRLLQSLNLSSIRWHQQFHRELTIQIVIYWSFLVSFLSFWDFLMDRKWIPN